MTTIFVLSLIEELKYHKFFEKLRELNQIPGGKGLCRCEVRVLVREAGENPVSRSKLTVS